MGRLGIGCLEVVGGRVGQRWLPREIVEVVIVDSRGRRHGRCKSRASDGVGDDGGLHLFQTRRWHEWDSARETDSDSSCCHGFQDCSKGSGVPAHPSSRVVPSSGDGRGPHHAANKNACRLGHRRTRLWPSADNGSYCIFRIRDPTSSNINIVDVACQPRACGDPPFWTETFASTTP